jgi:hypothetical protein
VNSASAPDAPCAPWGFWASLAWALLATAAWFATQAGLSALMLKGFGLDLDVTREEIDAVMPHGVFISIVAIAAVPVGLGVIALAVRRARCRLSDYLALGWPAPREWLIGVVTILVLLPVADFVSYLLGYDVTPDFVTDVYRSARDGGAVWLLALAVVAAAPVVEEVIFRGFLLPGLAPRIGAAGAMVLTSLGWSAMHMQYEPYYLLHIFVLGLALGWLRWRSGSTLLVIVLHALVNVFALTQAAVIVERIG